MSELSINSGDTAWMLIATALVLLMTPGLAFFYGGMVRSKNSVSTIFQNFVSMALVALIWVICGYSLVFSGNNFGFIGNLDQFMLAGITSAPHALSPSFPHILFVMFQGTFAIITPAIITGAFAERIRFLAWLPMMTLWSLLVYVPVAHWVWGPGGWIGGLGGLDFAGGLVVHMTSGFSALVAALMLGRRKDFDRENSSTHNIPLVLLGTALLWFGWFGFNAGSALGANGVAAHAFATTFIAASSAMLSWMGFDWIINGKPSAVGAGIGAVVGLVAITPAAGFVTIGAAMFIGFSAGIVCNFVVRLVKEKLGLDDTLDVFACHGVGGLFGAIMTGIFATTQVNPAGANGLLYGDATLLTANIIGGVVVIGYSMIMTFAIIKFVNVMANIRVSDSDEEFGLDHSQHGERAFNI